MSTPSQVAHPRVAATIGVLVSVVPVAYLGWLTGLMGGVVYFPIGNLLGLALLLPALWFVVWRWRGPRAATRARVAASILLLAALLFGWAAGVWVDYQFTDPARDF